jgi:hypothetical protein
MHLLKELSNFVRGKVFRKPLTIEFDKANNKITLNGLDLESYEKKNCVISA